MKSLAFASRNRRELFRDPLSLLFTLLLPVLLLLMVRMISANIPAGANAAFAVDQFAPGMAVFSLSFLSLFSGTLIASDRQTAFLARLLSSPLRGRDFALGYTLPLLLAAVLQGAVCFAAALVFGLPFQSGILVALLLLVPISLLFIGIGFLFGTLLTVKQVGGVGSILVNVATILGGTWFELSLVGGAFEHIGYALPFAHAVDAMRAAVAQDYSAILPHLLWCVAYAAVVYTLAILLFQRRCKG